MTFLCLLCRMGCTQQQLPSAIFDSGSCPRYAQNRCRSVFTSSGQGSEQVERTKCTTNSYLSGGAGSDATGDEGRWWRRLQHAQWRRWKWQRQWRGAAQPEQYQHFASKQQGQSAKVIAQCNLANRKEYISHYTFFFSFLHPLTLGRGPDFTTFKWFCEPCHEDCQSVP